MFQRAMGILAMVAALSPVELLAACGTDSDGNYCESKITYTGIGVSGHPNLVDGVVYAQLTDDGSWYWDNSGSKNMTFSALMAAKSAGAKIQIRWVPGTMGRGSKKIISVLMIP